MLTSDQKWIECTESAEILNSVRTVGDCLDLVAVGTQVKIEISSYNNHDDGH